MYRRMMLLLILAVLVLVFAVQNNVPVGVRFFSGHSTVSLSVLIFLVFIIGALLGASAFLNGGGKRKEEGSGEGRQDE